MLRTRLSYGLLAITLTLILWTLGATALFHTEDSLPLSNHKQIPKPINSLSEQSADLSEKKISSKITRTGSNSAAKIAGVATLVLLGTSITALLYRQITHLIPALPETHPNNELTKMISALKQVAEESASHCAQSNENLRHAKMVNRAILEAIPSPVFILGDDTEILQINPAAENLTQKLGSSNRLPLKIQHVLDECRQTRTSFLPEDPREALLFRLDEEEFYFLPRIFRFATDNTSPAGWAIILHNVSRIRWLDDMKTNLISTVSHEIKTPLTGIRMVLHLLLEERNHHLDEMQRLMVSSANEDCERLLTTLNTLLDLSRAESGATHLNRIPLDLLKSVTRTAQLFASAANSRGIQIQIETKDANHPEISADPVRLDEVLNNLVSNAVKHSPPGGTITLRLSKPDAEHLRVAIIDQGPGVPDACQSRIFERFYRAPGQKVDGVGLGLFISREIMRAHEGRIGLSERTQELTEFYVDVPIA